MKFFIRADASLQIGSGHIMRCLTLAHELSRRGHEVRFICRALPGHLGETIERAGFGLVLLPEPPQAGRLPESEASTQIWRWFRLSGSLYASEFYRSAQTVI